MLHGMIASQGLTQLKRLMAWTFFLLLSYARDMLQLQPPSMCEMLCTACKQNFVLYIVCHLLICAFQITK